MRGFAPPTTRRTVRRGATDPHALANLVGTKSDRRRSVAARGLQMAEAGREGRSP
jgi:hypothetical protein